MIGILWRYGGVMLFGFLTAWYVQGLRWETDVQERDLATATAITKNVDAVNQQLIASRAQTEDIRATFIDYKAGKENETNRLERCIASGKCGLRIAAKCPAVRADGTVSGGTGGGTAELTAEAGRAYWDLRRGLDRQFAELQFCRSELRKRSAKG